MSCNFDSLKQSSILATAEFEELLYTYERNDSNVDHLEWFLENTALPFHSKNLVDGYKSSLKGVILALLFNFGFNDAEKYKALSRHRTDILFQKNKEYSSVADPLESFKNTSKYLGISIDNVILVLLYKHLLSILKTDPNSETVTIDWLHEKFGDLLNYYTIYSMYHDYIEV